MGMDDVLNTAVGGAVVVGVLDRTIARRKGSRRVTRKPLTKRSGFNLWARYPSRKKAAAAARYLESRTHQETQIRKIPNKRQWAVYAH